MLYHIELNSEQTYAIWYALKVAEKQLAEQCDNNVFAPGKIYDYLCKQYTRTKMLCEDFAELRKGEKE